MSFKRFLLFTIGSSLFTFFAGCDEIAHPLIQKQVYSNLPTTPPAYRDSSTNYNVYKVLLEDAMGHTCSNCPLAVYAGDAIIAPSNSLSSQTVLLEENIGGYADTVTLSGYPNYAFKKDYRCEAGNNWLSKFTINLFPWGMINRAGYPSNMFVVYGNWSDSVTSQISKNPLPSVTINIHDSCWTSPRIIGAEFQLTFKKALTGNYLLETLIMEDSIIDWQLDNSVAYGADSLFVHRNVLRGSFDLVGTGITIPSTASSVVNGSWTSYQTYDFVKGENGKAASWNMAHCYIVAFVYNQSNYEVVQAEMVKIE